MAKEREKYPKVSQSKLFISFYAKLTPHIYRKKDNCIWLWWNFGKSELRQE